MQALRPTVRDEAIRRLGSLAKNCLLMWPVCYGGQHWKSSALSYWSSLAWYNKLDVFDPDYIVVVANGVIDEILRVFVRMAHPRALAFTLRGSLSVRAEGT